MTSLPKKARKETSQTPMREIPKPVSLMGVSTTELENFTGKERGTAFSPWSTCSS